VQSPRTVEMSLAGGASRAAALGTYDQQPPDGAVAAAAESTAVSPADPAAPTISSAARARAPDLIHHLQLARRTGDAAMIYSDCAQCGGFGDAGHHSGSRGDRDHRGPGARGVRLLPARVDQPPHGSGTGRPALRLPRAAARREARR